MATVFVFSWDAKHSDNLRVFSRVRCYLFKWEIKIFLSNRTFITRKYIKIRSTTLLEMDPHKNLSA